MDTQKTLTSKRNGKGTKEWADYSYNFCVGCEHGCRYCYAWTMACRWNEVMRRPGEWQKQTLNPNRAAFGAEVGAAGVVMFPTSHDITPQFLSQAVNTLRNLLANNQVLFVSKPHLTVVTTICEEFKRHKSDLLFRFTIGSLDADLAAFWEPGAPSPQERIEALKYAYKKGYATSVSIEPMLDTRENTRKLVAAVEPYSTDTVWIGKMQNIPRKHNSHVQDFALAAKRIKMQQTDQEILALVSDLKHHPKVRWKDSITAVLTKNQLAQ